MGLEYGVPQVLLILIPPSMEVSSHIQEVPGLRSRIRLVARTMHLIVPSV